MPVINSTPQLNNRADVVSHDMNSTSSPPFDSLVQSERAKAMHHKPDAEDHRPVSNMKQREGLREERIICDHCPTGDNDHLGNIRARRDMQDNQSIETMNMNGDQTESQISINNGISEAVITELDESGHALISESGPKVGDLMKGMEQHSEKGLKAGALLNHVINKSAEEKSVASYLIPAHDESGESVDPESGEGGKNVRSDTGLKTGDIMNRMSNHSARIDSGNDQLRDISAEEALHAEKAIKGGGKLHTAEADNLIFRKEVPAQAESDAQLIKDLKGVHTDEEAVDGDGADNRDNRGETGNKLMSGFSEQFNQENSRKNNSFTPPKVTQHVVNSSEANHINVNSSGTAYEGGRAVANLFTANAAKMPGFQELMDNIAYVIKGNNKLGLTVEHDNFGKLSINLSLEKGLVNVHIHTADRVVRELIENNIQYLVDTLNEEGVNIGDFSIALKDQRDNEGNQLFLNNEDTEDSMHKTDNDHHNSGLVNIFV